MSKKRIKNHAILLVVLIIIVTLLFTFFNQLFKWNVDMVRILMVSALISLMLYLKILILISYKN